MLPQFPSRRAVLQAMAAGAGATVLRAAEDMDPVSARIQADLVRHAGFGIKRSGSPGDILTAEWVAERLRAAAYKVDVLDFEAPFLVERSVRLAAGGMTLDLLPQRRVVGVHGSGLSAMFCGARDSSLVSHD
jgi:hypothetical protein